MILVPVEGVEPPLTQDVQYEAIGVMICPATIWPSVDAKSAAG